MKAEEYIQIKRNIDRLLENKEFLQRNVTVDEKAVQKQAEKFLKIKKQLIQKEEFQSLVSEIESYIIKKRIRANYLYALGIFSRAFSSIEELKKSINKENAIKVFTQKKIGKKSAILLLNILYLKGIIKFKP